MESRCATTSVVLLEVMRDQAMDEALRNVRPLHAELLTRESRKTTPTLVGPVSLLDTTSLSARATAKDLSRRFALERAWAFCYYPNFRRGKSRRRGKRNGTDGEDHP
ncbi:MAG: hypothetical protein DRH20_04955 [Deltaproteobacteria bacterium]|nr:MAG: hypothetical protein DRH20_04955 [Deltaproteobacteria bacterium]